MIESCIVQRLELSSNASAIAFPNDNIRTRACWLCHQEGSPLYKLTQPGIYEVEFTGTLTSATAGILGIGIYQDGVLLPCTVAAETIAAAGDLTNLSTRKLVKVCCNDNSTVTIGSVPSVDAGATPTPTATQIPIITAGNVVVKKIC